MKIFQNFKVRRLLKFFYKFIITIHVFESVPKSESVIKTRSKLFHIFDKKKILKNNIIKNYFKTNNNKKKRFEHSSFIGIIHGKKIVCSGWIHQSKNSRWNIEEIDKKISLKNEKILYDFFTHKEFRNRGYYKLLLKKIQNKSLNKKLIIYTVSNNRFSKKAILHSGFKFKKNLRKFF